jgi:hypothetical protein
MGFVYVFSLGHDKCCKIGHTDNIQRRLSEFRGETGSPADLAHFPVYIEVDDAHRQSIEAQAHKMADAYRQERGEWFNITPAEALAYIIEAASVCGHDHVIHDPDGVTPDGRRVLAEKQRAREEEKQRRDAESARQAALAESERQLVQREYEVAGHYDKQLELMSNPGPFLPWWIGCGIATAVVVGGMANMKDGPAIFWGALLGVVVAVFAREWWRGRKQAESAYVRLVADRDRAVAAVRKNAPQPIQPKAGGNEEQKAGGIGVEVRRAIPPQTGLIEKPQAVAADIAEHVRKSNARNAEIANDYPSAPSLKPPPPHKIPVQRETKTVPPAKGEEKRRVLEALESHPLTTQYLEQLRNIGFAVSMINDQLVVTTPGGKRTVIQYVYELGTLLSEAKSLTPKVQAAIATLETKLPANVEATGETPTRHDKPSPLVNVSTGFSDRMKSLHKITSTDKCDWPTCGKSAEVRHDGAPYCLGHYYEHKANAENNVASPPNNPTRL